VNGAGPSPPCRSHHGVRAVLHADGERAARRRAASRR
jgi:hypothetical protein